MGELIALAVRRADRSRRSAGAAPGAASGVALEECLAAAGDRSLDTTIEATARGLVARGVTQLPTVRFGRQFQEGEWGLAETAAPLEARAVSLRPLAPMG